MSVRAIVTIDFEASLGMPYMEKYDIRRGAETLIEHLGRANLKALFFVVGRMVETDPDVVESIAAAGHSVGFHGYTHDPLGGLSIAEIHNMKTNLVRAEDILEHLVGYRPASFRAPYLLGPHFYDKRVYEMLRENGYTWTSNREVRHPEELMRPDRLGWHGAWRPALSGHARLRHRIVCSSFLIVALNAGLVVREKRIASMRGRLDWLTAGTAPFTLDGLMEVPVTIPLDCDVLGLPRPSERTSDEFCDYAVAAILHAVDRQPGTAIITFHDWIITSANRIRVLDGVLAGLNARTLSVVASAIPAAD